MANDDRLLSVLPDKVLELGRAIQRTNYEYEVYATGKRANGVAFRSYHLVGPGSETLLDQLLSRASPGEVVYDAGANVGHYSLPLAAKGCRVHSFEPDPTAFARLEKNVAANPDVAVEPHEFGLSDEAGTLTFYVASRSTRSSFRRYTTERGDAAISGTAEVAVRTVDDLVSERGFPPPDHLKVDVEGFGLEVLRGSRATLREHAPCIYFEPHVVEDGGARGKREEKLRSLLERSGYDLRTFEDDSWLCLPAGRRASGTDA